MHVANGQPDARERRRVELTQRVQDREHRRRATGDAPGIGAPVRARREELRQQVAVGGVELDAGEAGVQRMPIDTTCASMIASISASVSARGAVGSRGERTADGATGAW